MSFTAEVKEQLLRINTSKRCCREAEFLAFLRMSGNISLAAGGQAGILAASGNAAIPDATLSWLRNFGSCGRKF